MSVGALEHRFWATLCEAVGLPELIDDHERDDRQVAVVELLEAKFLERDRDDWVALLAPHDACVAPVLSVDEVIHDEHLRARGLISGTGLGSLLAGSDRDDVAAVPDVLRELGVREEEREHLLALGVIERSDR